MMQVEQCTKELQKVVKPGQSMRIGLDGDVLGRKRTGDESYLASLMRGLNRVGRDHSYRVFVRDEETVSSMFQELDRFSFTSVSPKSIWLRHAFGFSMKLRRDRVDLLHVQYFVPPMAPCPTVLTIHDISFAVRPELFTFRDRVLLQTLVPRSIRRAHRVIVDVEHTKSDLVNAYNCDPDRVSVIPLAADPQYRVLDAKQCQDYVTNAHGCDTPFILYVGTLQPRKNVTTLVAAYGQFRDKSGLPHKLILVGKPKYRFQSVFEQIAASKYKDDIIFTGFVPEEHLPTYYNAASVFAFPSLYEGFGLPVLEAMACGTPVITTNTSSLPEVSGDAAILVDPLAPEQFCDALIEVLGDSEVARAMSQRGLQQAALFSWDRTARETLAVYREVLEEHACPSNSRKRHPR